LAIFLETRYVVCEVADTPYHKRLHPRTIDRVAGKAPLPPLHRICPKLTSRTPARRLHNASTGEELANSIHGSGNPDWYSGFLFSWEVRKNLSVGTKARCYRAKQVMFSGSYKYLPNHWYLWPCSGIVPAAVL
jgi:hypothetical protein